VGQHALGEPAMINRIHLSTYIAILWADNHEFKLTDRDSRAQPRLVLPLFGRMSEIAVLVVDPGHHPSLIDRLLEGRQQTTRVRRVEHMIDIENTFLFKACCRDRGRCSRDAIC
jgi:hypothetical protein